VCRRGELRALTALALTHAHRAHTQAGRPFLGICLGLQLLFDGSEESGGVEGLGIIPGAVRRFPASPGLLVPHIGWNGVAASPHAPLLAGLAADKSRVYFVHSYRAVPEAANAAWVAGTTRYGGADFVSAVARGAVAATQFHPEKSGAAGLNLLDRFLSGDAERQAAAQQSSSASGAASLGESAPLAKRVIACLDVRANDAGDLVVTKGDSYDVREKGAGADGENAVRNLGKPVELAARYADEGADEVTFLNITGYRDCPLADAPMLAVLRAASERVFVPLTVGGGIRDTVDGAGRAHTALAVAAEYFRNGADKVSIGSDAVAAAEAYYAAGAKRTGASSIEAISEVYGAQAVVVSIDPRRVYVADAAACKHACVKALRPGPNGETHCWYQCTVSGGREGRDIGAVELAVAVEALGAGEILLNCIDEDGQGNGFDTALVDAVSSAVRIPVIASSGAGKPSHFVDVFAKSAASAALAAGIFHRSEVSISDVKSHMHSQRIPTRLT
jgi:glutamine amidotransferase/cyclase